MSNTRKEIRLGSLCQITGKRSDWGVWVKYPGRDQTGEFVPNNREEIRRGSVCQIPGKRSDCGGCAKYPGRDQTGECVTNTREKIRVGVCAKDQGRDQAGKCVPGTRNRSGGGCVRGSQRLIRMHAESKAALPPLGPIEGHKWFSTFPANESLRRTSLHLSLSAKSNFDPVQLRSAVHGYRLGVFLRRKLDELCFFNPLV